MVTMPLNKDAYLMKLSKDKQQAKVLTNLSIVISLVVALSLPIVDAVVSYQGLASSLYFKARIKAYAQSDIISTLPNTWMYAENRIYGVLEREPVILDNEFVQLFDENGGLIISTGSKIESWKIERSYPLKDINKVVGKITVSTSLSNLYLDVFIVSILGLILGSVVFLILRILPISALKRISDELYTEKERAEVTLNSIKETIIVSDMEGRLLYFNTSAEKMFGNLLFKYKNENFTELLQITDNESGAKIESTLVRTLDSKKITTCNERSVLSTPSNLQIEVEERCTPVFDSKGSLTGAVLCLRDVTEARENLKRKSWEASHDILTGLVNRQEFERRTTNAIKKANNTDVKYVVFYMDLDRFKVINDSCGHNAGDELLKQLTRIIGCHIRGGDTFARLGGDEFGLLLENCSEEKGIQIANALLSAVESFQFFWEQKIHTIGISIGITVINRESFSIMDVLGQADSACYWAKDQGRQRFCVFKESDVQLVARRSETGWVEKITAALKGDRFVLYHQTYRSLKGEDTTSVHLEILLRMLSEDDEIILPYHFFPAAERYNLVAEIDRWVINKVLSEYHTVKELYPNKKLMISINLSGGSINSPNLLDYIKNKILEFNVNPEELCFEITETVAVKDIVSAIKFISGCKKLGVKFALDDFGAGSSSFGYLKQLPVDYLKIDGGFVKNIEHDPIDRAMTETMNKIGHIMQKTTVAEFAENQSIIDILDDMGVDYAQGYGVCLPKPLLPDNKP
jgi:diguanylate cyclase (GGDEF)-like protein/PAS domain S-box-containing protein